ncbi:B2 bradykinin receptor-like [Channa argus]|uniref:B2 bradykinin receptor-like n=1 Tax=Channa argus TaxID=215402 RepID=UPI00294521B6|nr:hypothetical protein Q8A73_017575 [Channa argus]
MAVQATSIPDFGTPALYGHQNHTNGTECPDQEAWDWVATNQPVYILIISVLGIVLNVFVLIVFCLHKKPCTVAEIYLSNLAAADLVLVSCLPFWAVSVSNDFHWPFGLFLCKVVNLGIKMNASCSIYFLVLVSIDRYVALVHTMSHGRMRRPKYAKLGCLLMWGFGLLLSAPTLIFREVKHFPEYGVHACFLNYPNLTVELVCDGLMIPLIFIIPVSIILFCTIKIVKALRIQSIERFSGEKTEQKATTLILVVLLAFLVCWVPFHVVTALDVLLKAKSLGGCDITTVVEMCNQISTYLAFFNSVLNPVVYVIVGKNFRKKVWDLFKQWGFKKKATCDSTRSNQSSTLKTFT